MTDEAQVQRLYDAAVERARSASTWPSTTPASGGQVDVVDMTDEQWSLVLDVTLTGTFRCTRAALRHFYAQGEGGVIVNNASVLGLAGPGRPGPLRRGQGRGDGPHPLRAVEAAPHDVRVNAVSPSLAVHPFLNRVMADEELAELARREVFGRGAEVWEVANVIAFLASDYATYMTGEVVSVSSQHP